MTYDDDNKSNPTSLALTERGRNAILGAFVADAATMGLHWLYDQERIQSLANHKLEFRTPAKTDFEGSKGYFAHPDRCAGDQSQYGEQMLVMLRSLAECDGHYNPLSYATAFQVHFGYGGEYIGYIDRPTRDTLNYLARMEWEAADIAKGIEYNGDAATQRAIIAKVLEEFKESSGEASNDTIFEAIMKMYDDKDLANYANTILTGLVDKLKPFPGADDTQLPALSKLPPLLATNLTSEQLMQHVESSVRVTNDNSFAVQNGLFSARILQAAIKGEALETISCRREGLSADMSKKIDQALADTSRSVQSITAHFGLSCQLEYAMPSIVYNIATCSSYAQAVKDNILAGGDNCGRSILLGAVLGAHFGVGGDTGIPEAWLGYLSRQDEIYRLLDKLSAA